MIFTAKNWITLLMLLLFVSTNNALGSQDSDVVYLKNGSKIVGQIIKFEIDKEVVIKIESGTEFSYKMSDVDKIDFKSESFYQYKNTSSEFGVTFGTPAALNLVIAKHFDKLMLKASGFYLGNVAKGLQIEFGYKLSEFARTYHAISLVGGLSELRAKQVSIFGGGESYVQQNWNYVGIAYNLNTNGFYLQTGLSVGEGDFDNPQFMLQIGYVYQYRN